MVQCQTTYRFGEGNLTCSAWMPHRWIDIMLPLDEGVVEVWVTMAPTETGTWWAQTLNISR